MCIFVNFCVCVFWLFFTDAYTKVRFPPPPPQPPNIAKSQIESLENKKGVRVIMDNGHVNYFNNDGALPAHTKRSFQELISWTMDMSIIFMVRYQLIQNVVFKN